MSLNVSDEVLEVAMKTYGSMVKPGGKSPDREAMRAALGAALKCFDAQTAERTDWFLYQAWSARDEDGRLVPGELISASGINFEKVSGKPGHSEMQRMYLEDLGKIEKGAPYFCVEAPFRLMTTAEEENEYLDSERAWPQSNRSGNLEG